MKKYLFLGLSILSVFFISDRVEALSFTATNGKEYIVDSEEKLLDYCYFTYYKDKNKNILGLIKTNNSTFPYKCFTSYTNSNYYIYQRNNTFILYEGNVSSTYLYYHFKYNFDYNGTGWVIQDGQQILYFNKNVYTDDSFSNLYFTPNFTIDDIEARYGIIPKYKITYYLNNEIYKEIEVEKGSNHQLENYSYNSDLYIFSGWTIENELDISNITSDIIIRGTLEQKAITPVYIKNFNDFPITKTEFYSLLVLLGTLIMIIFLKWCFPFKGGSDLR